MFCLNEHPTTKPRRDLGLLWQTSGEAPHGIQWILSEGRKIKTWSIHRLIHSPMVIYIYIWDLMGFNGF